MRDYQVKRIEALSRGFTVLQTLTDMGAASLHDLHRETGIAKATLTRILKTAHDHGLIWQRLADGAFLPSRVAARRVGEDDTAWLVELASPVMEELVRSVQWPSVIAVPRLDYMEVMETNSSRAYFDDIPYGPTRYRANYLRSSVGRAYLAFCPTDEREAVVRRLRERNGEGDRLAFDTRALERLITSARQLGYATRAEDFGGHGDKPRTEQDDGRDSIAMPIRLHGQVLATINLTWRRKLVSQRDVVTQHLADLRECVTEIERRANVATEGAFLP